MVWRGLGLGIFSAPCNKYHNPHVLRNEDSAHFLASFCYWLKSWWDDRARENWERLWEPSEGLPVYCVSIGSSASTSRTFEHRCLHAICWFLLFATMRLCAVVSLASFVDCWSWTYFWPGGPNAASLCLSAELVWWSALAPAVKPWETVRYVARLIRK